MSQERKTQKKQDYKVLSTVKCPHCGEFMKYNSILKNHKLCYICYKVTQGKATDEQKNIQNKNQRQNGKPVTKHSKSRTSSA